MCRDRNLSSMVGFTNCPQGFVEVSGGSTTISADGKGRCLAIQRIVYRISITGVVRHSFLGVVVLVGALSSENERRNRTWRASRSSLNQCHGRSCCLFGKCPPIRADRFLAGKFFDRNSPIGDLCFGVVFTKRTKKKGEQHAVRPFCIPKGKSLRKLWPLAGAGLHRRSAGRWCAAAR